MTSINKGGRPRLSADQKRDKVIKFSCTQVEYEFFQEHAERAGYKQVARFLHDVNIAMIDDGQFSYSEQTKVNSELLAALIGLANNVNQAMHVVHAQGVDNLPNFYHSLQEAQQVIYNMGQIAQLGVRRECHIEDKAEVQHGDA
ncbi:hypothetical protein [Photobacterium lipolyticum]|uniref:Plasmid mobilization relaxosome protein MobC n=1 Tax=Photobacterium lipolyticum TaxID=266810 RepID=A0A2T3N318_9GAMM|nr:hypothetical protein [Photobacterium lipolyticum]PSW06772.1 hypothetical protein C9I89_04390 [Photobacterium lipolyticum]